MCCSKTASWPFLRGFPDRRDARARDPAHAEFRRRHALFGALRDAFRRTERGNLRAEPRLPARADRRPARLPRRVRQDGARRVAQRHRQPRLCRRAVPGGRLSRRHAVGDLRSHRAEGELQPAERRRLRAHAGRESARANGDRIRALGDGEEARRGRRGRRSPRPRPPRRRRAGRARRRLPCRSMLPPTTSRSPARPIAGATMPRASASTMSTA